jgi:Asp-tRNA(Asn)/Glu-tRNA(Gln) amidotransferase A subunit family amidase
MSELTGLTIAEARDALRKKEITARELTEAHVAAIEAANTALNAFILPTPRNPMPGSPRAKASRSMASRSASRTCSAPRMCAPRPAPAYSTASSRSMNPP